MGRFPSARLLLLSELYGVCVCVQMYITCGDAPPHTACIGAHSSGMRGHTPLAPQAQTYSTSTCPASTAVRLRHARTHLRQGCTTSAHGHKAAAGTHTPAARRADPRHPRAHACATHTRRASTTHSYSVDAHVSGTHGHAPMVRTHFGHAGTPMARAHL